jgi:hypothetical protein
MNAELAPCRAKDFVSLGVICRSLQWSSDQLRLPLDKIIEVDGATPTVPGCICARISLSALDQFDDSNESAGLWLIMVTPRQFPF